MWYYSSLKLPYLQKYEVTQVMCGKKICTCFYIKVDAIVSLPKLERVIHPYLCNRNLYHVEIYSMFNELRKRGQTCEHMFIPSREVNEIFDISSHQHVKDIRTVTHTTKILQYTAMIARQLNVLPYGTYHNTAFGHTSKVTKSRNFAIMLSNRGRKCDATNNFFFAGDQTTDKLQHSWNFVLWDENIAPDVRRARMSLIWCILIFAPTNHVAHTL